MKHTATPWRVTDGTTIKEDCRPISEGGVVIASACGYSRSGFFPSDEEAVVNAEFIVRACNAHEQLVTAVKGSHSAIDRLMARVIELDPTFMPSESNIWPVLKANGEALAAAGAA